MNYDLICGLEDTLGLFLKAAGGKGFDNLEGFAHWRRVSVHGTVPQWGGERCRGSRACTLESHARQHISSGSSTMTWANESALGQSDFCPFASQGLSRL